MVEEIINLSEEKAKLSFNEEKKEHIVDFGQIDRRFDASVSLLLKTDKELDRTVASSCGCTTPDLQKTDGGYILNIKYNNTNLGPFTKTITVNSASRRYKQVFKIKGMTHATN